MSQTTPTPSVATAECAEGVMHPEFLGPRSPDPIFSAESPHGHDPAPHASGANTHWRRWRNRGMALAVALIVGVSAYAGYAVQTGNFHTIHKGHAYRAGQLDPAQLERAFSRHGIRSIVNLRGSNPDAIWYQQEIETAARHGVIHQDWRMGSGDELPLERMDELVALLRDVPKPVLIHCSGGADRSGLVSALYSVAILGHPAHKASEALSVWYGHAPLIRPHVTAMDRSFWRYARLRASSGGVAPATGSD